MRRLLRVGPAIALLVAFAIATPLSAGGAEPCACAGPAPRLKRVAAKAAASVRHAMLFDMSFHLPRSILASTSLPVVYSMGMNRLCRILPIPCERWPLPVVSSTRIISPAPMTRTSPSLAVIFTPASRFTMY